jgi:hypothetical protein
MMAKPLLSDDDLDQILLALAGTIGAAAMVKDMSKLHGLVRLFQAVDDNHSAAL